MTRLNAKRPELHGHRGARGLWPENTLESFVAAIEIGVDAIELDVGVTRDGIAVVHHDPTLNRDTTRDASGAWLKASGPPLHTLSYAELAAYNVGGLRRTSEYGLRFPRQRRLPVARIPTLAQAVELLMQAGILINIEVKSIPTRPDDTPPPAQMAAAVVSVLRDSGALRAPHEVLLQSFDWRILRAARELEPALPISCLTVEASWEDNIGRKGRAQPAESLWTDGLELHDFGGSVPRMVQAFGSDSWSPYVANVEAAGVQEAHALGLRVITWTVNRSKDMRKMLDLGVDGIISDLPDRLRAIMHKRGLSLPPAGGRESTANGENASTTER